MGTDAFGMTQMCITMNTSLNQANGTIARVSTLQSSKRRSNAQFVEVESSMLDCVSIVQVKEISIVNIMDAKLDNIIQSLIYT